MLFADLTLSKRPERTEGYAGTQFAKARLRADPTCGAAWMEHSGTQLILDGVDSPVTQSFGLGLFAEPGAEDMRVIESFFEERGAVPIHEVSPFAGVVTLDLLCERNYRPIEFSSVLYRLVDKPLEENLKGIQARLMRNGEEHVWSSISARGWAENDAALAESIERFGSVISFSESSLCFLGESDGQVGAAGVLWIHEGVALFGGSSTVPEFRGRGLQAALLRKRMCRAVEQGCDLAMIVTEAGSKSQRNAEREGFQVAYTRVKWRLVK